MITQRILIVHVNYILCYYVAEQKKYKCRRKCSVASVTFDCDTRKYRRRFAKDSKSALVEAAFDLEIEPLPPKRE